MLRHIAQPLPHLRRVVGPPAHDLRGAGIGPDQPQRQLDGGALSRPVGPQQPGNALADLKVDGVQCQNGPVPLGKGFRFKESGHLFKYTARESLLPICSSSERHSCYEVTVPRAVGVVSTISGSGRQTIWKASEPASKRVRPEPGWQRHTIAVSNLPPRQPTSPPPFTPGQSVPGPPAALEPQPWQTVRPALRPSRCAIPA